MSDLIVIQPRLLTVPVASVVAIKPEEAYALLAAWGHKLNQDGEKLRPFRSEAWALEIDGNPVSVAVSASICSDHVTGHRAKKVNGGPKGAIVRIPVRWERVEVVELARLGSDPAHNWATRPMLRLWREVFARRWSCWPVKAAVSYSHNRYHDGELYRFDGWDLINDRCGSSGGGTYSRQRRATDAVHGRKSLWDWRYPDA